MKKIVRKHEWLGSSADPDKLAATWKGVLIGLIPLAMYVLDSLGVNVTQGELTELVNSVAVLVSVLVTLFGLVRKLLYSKK